MTDTPKKWKDMARAEKGALLLAALEGARIQALAVDQDGTFWVNKAHPESNYFDHSAYRIAPPKFLPLEVGKVYRTECRGDWTCEFIKGDRAYCIRHASASAAYVWDVFDGTAKAFYDKYNITGLSENQGDEQ